MADFAAVLKKTLEQMGETGPEAREKVYDKARETVRRQIDGMEKAPPQAAIDRQFTKLEDAITSVEAEFAPSEDALELDELLDEVVPDPETKDKLDDLSAEPGEDIDPELAAEAEALSEPDEEPKPMPTPDEVVAEVTTVSPEEVAQATGEITDDAEGGADGSEAASNDPLAEFINEHTEASDQSAESVEAAAEDLKKAAGGEGDEAGEDTGSEKAPELAAVGGPIAGSGATEKEAGSGRMIKILLLLAVLGGGGYYAYANQTELAAWWKGLTGATDSADTSGDATDDQGESTAEGEVPVHTVTTTTVENTEGETEQAAVSESDPTSEVVDAADPNASEAPVKFTQRLTEDGTEVDEGPAPVGNETVEVAEGSSVSEQTAGSEAEPLASDQSTSVVVPEPAQPEETISGTPVGQRSIFYEERTGSQEGTALSGATVWSIVNQSPGGELPVEPAIRAETTIPELGLEMEMTIRRNGDSTFPASHIVELFFTVPDTFEGRGIADVQRVTFKTVEQDPGNALIAVPAPIDQNIFMIALTDAATAIETNVNLMKRENWIDIPMQYTSGRRALITLEKGIPGERVFNEVFAAWDAAPIN